jgi:hypothetical protein
MIRFVLRFIGFLCLAAGFIFLIYDGTKSIADHAIIVTKLSEFWENVHAPSLQLVRVSAERHAPWLVDPVLNGVLTAPTWLVLSVVAAVLILLGRKKRPLIGYER